MSPDGSKPLGMKLTKVQFVTVLRNVGSVTEEAQDNVKFQDLFQLLTTDVTAEEYLSFDNDVETPEEAINTTQVHWRETTQERCIQDKPDGICLRRK